MEQGEAVEIEGGVVLLARAVEQLEGGLERLDQVLPRRLQIGQAVYNRAQLNTWRRQLAGTSGHAEGWALYAERLMQELAGSREDLAQWLDIESPCGLAYPFGIPGADVDADTRCAARSAGFRYAVLNSPGTVTAETDRYGLPRLPVENAGADAFASLISRATGRPNR